MKRDLVGRLGLEKDKVRVIAPAVGGGFGAKVGTYPEQFVVSALAVRLGRPVRYIETRSENMVAMTHGRAQVQDVQLGATRDGTITGLKLRVVQDVGAYPQGGAFLPELTRMMASGVYAIPRADVEDVCVVTNTTPLDAYRGAGRPEAAAMIERAVDLLADELGMDRVDLRRKNLIPKFDRTHQTVTEAKYDVGDYEMSLDTALEGAGYQALRTEQAERRARGDRKQLGIGVSVYVEVTGFGKEFGSVEVHEDGTATIRTGTSPHGQGHETAFAQLASGVLRIPFENITVLHSDTALLPRGDGTMGSRSLQLGGSAIHRAGEEVVEKARVVAAHLLEASPADIELTEEGTFAIAGAPERSVDWPQIATTAADASALPEGVEPGLSAQDVFDAGGNVVPVRRARRRRRGGPGDRRGAIGAVRCRGRLRPHPEPPAGRGPGARGPDAGRRPGPVRGRRVRRARQPADRHADVLRDAERGRADLVGDHPHADADVPEPPGGQGDRRVGDDRLDTGRAERRHRRGVPSRGAPHRHPADARAGVARDPGRERLRELKTGGRRLPQRPGARNRLHTFGLQTGQGTLPAMKQPRLKDVAEAAGVHVATASRALDDRRATMVRPETVARVRTAAADLGYRVNRMARGLKMSRSFAIGMLIPDITNPFFPPIVRGVEDGFAETEYRLVLGNTDNDAEKERRSLTGMLELQVDGLLLAMARRRDPLVEELREGSTPFVLVNRTIDRGGVSAVIPDDQAGMTLAVEHLADLGHQSIAHLGGPLQHLHGSSPLRRVRGRSGPAGGLARADRPREGVRRARRPRGRAGPAREGAGSDRGRRRERPDRARDDRGGPRTGTALPAGHLSDRVQRHALRRQIHSTTDNRAHPRIRDRAPSRSAPALPNRRPEPEGGDRPHRAGTDRPRVHGPAAGPRGRLTLGKARPSIPACKGLQPRGTGHGPRPEEGRAAMSAWRVRGAVAAIGAFALILTGCSSNNSSQNESKKPVVIGISLSSSGDFSDPSAAAKKGYELWADTINKSGGLMGRQVQLKIVDDASSPDQVVTNYQNLITKDKANFVFGPFSTLLIAPAAKVANRYGYSRSSSRRAAGPPIFQEGLHNVFFVQPAPVVNSADVFASYILSLPADQQPKTAAYPELDDPFAAPIAEEVRHKFEAAGIKTVYKQVYPAETVGLHADRVEDGERQPRHRRRRHADRRRVRAREGDDRAELQPEDPVPVERRERPGELPRQGRGPNNVNGIFSAGDWYPSENSRGTAPSSPPTTRSTGPSPSTRPRPRPTRRGRPSPAAVNKLNSLDNAEDHRTRCTRERGRASRVTCRGTTSASPRARTSLLEWVDGELGSRLPGERRPARPGDPQAAVGRIGRAGSRADESDPAGPSGTLMHLVVQAVILGHPDRRRVRA